MAALTIAGDARALAEAAAERLATLVEQAAAERGSATLCLTGGSTPRDLYALLADPRRPWRGRVPWPRMHLFWGDERHVPPEHADSNFGMAAAAMIHHVPVAGSQVHRLRGEIADAAAAAREYAGELAAGFARAGRADRTFDVMLLGLGEDAHIASIFPGSELLVRRPGTDGRPPSGLADDDRVAAVWAPHLGAWRITLTPDAILDARAIVMLVAVAAKADAVHAALEGPADVARWPAQLLRDADARVEWFVDRAAASRLRRAV